MTPIQTALYEIKTSSGTGPRPLINLINAIRPSVKEEWSAAVENFRKLMGYLQEDEELRVSFKQYLEKIVLSRKTKTRVFTDPGIPSNEGFFTELRLKVFHLFIPPLEKRQDLLNLLNILFPRRNDYKWLGAIPIEDWQKFFRLLDMLEFYRLPQGHSLREAMENAIQVVSYRISSIGLEPKITDKLPELNRPESPFIEQNKELIQYLAQLNSGDYDEEERIKDYKHLLVMLNQCQEYAMAINRQKHKFGASLTLTNMMFRLKENIKRLKTLLELINEQPERSYMEREVSLLLELVAAENKKHNLSEYVSGHLSLLAFQITENSGRTGEHYITKNQREFLRLGVAALGGGFIVSFFTIFKAELAEEHLPLLIEAFAFGLNYAIAFLLIFVTHSTLATKHPAMTAQRIAKAMDEDSESKSLDNLTSFIVKVIRSQAIAFAGNIIMAFLMAYFLSALFYDLAGHSIVKPDKAHHLIEELHPWKSLALFHAAIAGVGLFLTGVVSGFYDNQSLYHQISLRLKKHRMLRKIFGSRKLIRISDYIGENLGNLNGNIFLGFYLGSIAAFGEIVGLPLDIRHITFSSGNFGLALGTLSYVPKEVILYSVLGIAGIGFMNFAFSFGLAMAVAIKSRNLRFRQSAVLLRKLIVYFVKHPFDFIFPPKYERKAPDKDLVLKDKS